jgi:two-component system nitrogen regulation response regulator GlnG
LTPEILGQAPAMQEVFRAIGRLSQSSATVLITGESGSGKELVARAVHRHSPRADKPFIAINTAAIPRDLLESELFGHERGAFTGAATQRQGRFEQAEGGTLFLDEIGDMPAEMQTRLLRVLSDGHYYRVGGHSPLRTRVRIIAATHQDLEARVGQGLFREDLFHRLNVIRVRLPSLRERREDIPILARHFLQKSASELAVEGKRFSEAALKHLCAVDFPGNVRQLENLCHWLTVMAPGQLVELADLPPELRDTIPTAQASDWGSALAQEVDRLLTGETGQVHEKLLHVFERVLINRALAHTGGRRIEAAQALGIGRNTITRKIQELGLDSVGAAGDDREVSSSR